MNQSIIKLILIDNEHDDVCITVDRIKLKSHWSYFDKLLLNDLDSYSIVVPENQFMANFIMNLFGKIHNRKHYTKWNLCLVKIQCKSFLGIDYQDDIEELSRTVIPTYGFDLLLKTAIDSIGINNLQWEIIRLINRSLPNKFDLSSYPNSFIKKIIDGCTLDCIVGGDSNIVFFDLLSGQKLFKLESVNKNTHVYNTCCSSDMELVISANSDRYIYIWNISTRKILHKLKSKTIPHTMHISSNNKLLFISNAKKIKIIDIFNRRVIKKINNYEPSFCISSDDKIIGINNKCTIDSFEKDSGTFRINKKYTIDSFEINGASLFRSNCIQITLYHYNKIITAVNCSKYQQSNAFETTRFIELDSDMNHSNIIVFGSYESQIIVLDASANNLIIGSHTESSISSTKSYVSTITISPDNKYIAVGYSDGYINIFNISNAFTRLHRLKYDYCVKHIRYSIDQKFIVSVDTFGGLKVSDAQTGQSIKHYNGYTSNNIDLIKVTNHQELMRIKNNLSANQLLEFSRDICIAQQYPDSS